MIGCWWLGAEGIKGDFWVASKLDDNQLFKRDETRRGGASHQIGHIAGEQVLWKGDKLHGGLVQCEPPMGHQGGGAEEI